MLSGPEMMSSFRLPGPANAIQGAGKVVRLPFCAKTTGDTFNPLYFKQLQAKKKMSWEYPDSRLNNLLFMSHLLIHRKEGRNGLWMVSYPYAVVGC